MTSAFVALIARTGLSAGIALAATVSFARQGAPAEPQPPAGTQPPPAQPGAAPQAVQLHPGLKLGLRARNLKMQIPVVATLVIVPDAASYVAAISKWEPKKRYPVLIDDGSMQAREDIGRFVRGFKPTSVVRWSASPAAGGELSGAAPNSVASIEHAVASAWGAKPDTMPKYLVEYWKSMGFASPGLVVASVSDPAWPAALALAAGHGQPIVWYDAAGSAINGDMLENEVDALAKAIDEAAEATGLSWRGLGDDLDAVTLCLNSAAKYKAIPDPKLAAQVPVKPGDLAAVTDRIGRHSEGGALAPRWAWASQVFGNERRSAYRAMCSLFLETTSAWLFDGYQSGQSGYSDFDCTKAGEILTAAGLTVTVDDAPRQGRADWRARAAKPLDAGLVLVNTSGMPNYFDLQPGKARCGDIPMLSIPAMVHVVHSWSLAYPAGRESVGGKWLDNGAYAYIGSVQEPYLSAFVPTPLVAQRLVPFNADFFGGFAWGAAGRHDNSPIWRVACMGDPLITVGRAAPRPADARLPLEGTTDVETEMRAAIKEKQFARAIALLALLGRDDQAARVTTAVLADQPAQFTADVAAAGIMSLSRAGKGDAIATVYAKLDAKVATDGSVLDALWLGTINELKTTTDRNLLNILRRHLRASQASRDALDLSAAWERLLGKPAALAMLSEVRSAVKDDGQRQELDDAIKGYR